jgi:hypothetical protein
MVWNLVRRKVPEGMILPWWALTVRAALYPLEFFYWSMSQQAGYQWQNDTWLINGVTYSGEAMRWLAKAQGETYRVSRTGETVTLERVHNDLGNRRAAFGASVLTDGLCPGGTEKRNCDG